MKVTHENVSKRNGKKGRSVWKASSSISQNRFAWDLLSEIRIRSEIRSGSAPKIGYPGCPDPNPDSKILDPSKPDPDILIFRSGYPDPDPYF
ncbi:hypothetical protein YC2023_035908 [Brassica napus]